MDNKGDIGLEEDLAFALAHLVALEHHAEISYGMTKDKKWIEVENIAREIRQKWQKLLVKKNPTAHEWCFKPQTKIITNNGFKNIEQITSQDYVLTHQNRFKKVIKLFERRYEGEIIKLYCNYSNIPLNVTPNHLFLVADNLRKPQKDCWKRNYKEPKFVWKEAKHLTRNDFIYLPRYTLIKDINELNVEFSNNFNFKENINININNYLMRLIGLYLAEGCHCEGFDKHGWATGYVSFTFSIKENDLINFVKDTFLSEFNYNIRSIYRPEKSIVELCTGKRVFRKFFSQFGDHSYNKNIPGWIINLPKLKLVNLVKGMFEGDGCKSKFNFAYTTVSKDLAYNLRLILNKLGILCNMSNRGKNRNSLINGRKIISKRDMYTLSISGNSARKLANLINVKYDGGKKTSGQFGHICDDYFLIPVLKTKKVNYKGKLYNLEVEEDNSYCTINGIAHNCQTKHLLGSFMGLSEIGNRYNTTKQYNESCQAYDDATRLMALMFVINEEDKGENS